jgi:branched-chain amino acid aminotransferase
MGGARKVPRSADACAASASVAASMQVEELASVDGRISPTSEATLPLPDDGFFRGDGVFEVARLYGGRPFAMAEHWDRLERSAAAIDLPVARPAFERELEALLARHGEADAQLRVVATRGGRRLLLIEQLMQRGESVRVATVTYAPTVILDRVKSLSYAANMHATRIAKERGSDEAVFVTPDGTILEPPTSTIFWATPEGTLRTPSLENPILDSITRDRIVRLCDVEEGVWDASELDRASEAFLASTTREVQPVSAIDGRSLEWPGPRTAEAAERFARSVSEELGDGP